MFYESRRTLIQKVTVSLLERNESRRVGSSNTRSTVPDRLVRNTVLAKVGTNHFRLDLNTQHHLTVVDTNDVSDHIREDGDVSEMGLYGVWLIHTGGVLFCLSHLVDEGLVSLLYTPSEGSSVAGVGHVEELLGTEV